MSKSSPPARLLLLDTYGIVYAAFHALPELTTSQGVRIEAAYGFANTLTKIIADVKPTHVVACFDRGLPKARIERFAEYKAQRAAMPDDLRSQFTLVRKILETFRIPILEIEGEEADDVIATLATEAETTTVAPAGAGLPISTVVLTGDNDLLQIVDERTIVLVRSRSGSEPRRYDVAAVRERFDLEPGQLADYRGLKGDPSDNLPGIPGVGEKTAVKLIKAAGTLDALLADPARAGTAKLEALIREHGEMARTCRDVSVIGRDLPVKIPWAEARYDTPPVAELYVLYRDLEFRTLLARLPAPTTEALLIADDRPKIEGSYRTWVAATEAAEFGALAEALRAGANRPETVAIAFVRDEIGVSAGAGTGFAFGAAAFDVPAVRDAFATLLAAPIAAHDAKHASARLRELGLPLPAFADDTMIAAHLLDPSSAYARIEDAVGHVLALVVPDDVAAHADAVLRFVPAARDRLAHRDQLALYDDVERPLAAILAGMEARGIAVDLPNIESLAIETAEATERLQEAIHALAGEPFNIGSPQQLGRVLFEMMALPSGGRTKTGYATGSEILLPLARDHEIVRLVLEWREVTKLRSTYLDVIPKMLDARGRLHTQFNQTSTATGRLSSTNPNLQNIPVRTELGRRIRRAFVAPPGRVLLAADYSQIELRIMAHLSGDEAMREAFRAGEDIHDVTARGIFAIAEGDVATRDQRRIAKSVNFGLLYGMSEFGLAQRLEIDRTSARAMTEAYFARFPSVRAYIARNLEFGRENGYVPTVLGRRRYMPDLRSRNYPLRAAAEREATNAPMQGSAADLMKLAMVRVEATLAIEEPTAELLLQIHDELVFEVPRERAEAVARIVRAEMEGALELSVPLEVVVKVGPSLYEVEPLIESDDASLPVPAEAS